MTDQSSTQEQSVAERARATTPKVYSISHISAIVLVVFFLLLFILWLIPALFAAYNNYMKHLLLGMVIRLQKEQTS